jgi:membrane protease YdiL (CAAX protease family)
MNQRAARPALEALGVFAGLCVAMAALTRLGDLSRPLRFLTGLTAPNLMLWAPLAIVYFARRDFTAYGLTFELWPKRLLRGFLMVGTLLPPFVLGYWVFWDKIVGRELAWRLDWSLLPTLLTQFLVVSIPEEVFFRGYLLPSFAQAWPSRPLPFIGEYGPAIVVTAACFAVAHVAAEPRAMRLFVFFPALLFGLLRVRTGSVIAPIAAHTLANTMMYVMEGRV